MNLLVTIRVVELRTLRGGLVAVSMFEPELPPPYPGITH